MYFLAVFTFSSVLGHKYRKYRCACLSVPKMKKQKGKDSSQNVKRKVNAFTIVDCHRDVHGTMALLKLYCDILSKSKVIHAASSKQITETSVKICQSPDAVQSSVAESKGYPTCSDAEQMCDKLPLPPPGTALIHPFCLKKSFTPILIAPFVCLMLT